MLSRQKEKGALAVVSILFFCVYCWFGAATPPIFNSPDETANYFYINRYALNGDFFVAEPLNHFLNNLVRPRSISFNGFSLVPQGFIGLAWFYGFLAKVFSLAALKFFTPALAIAAALAFYQIIKTVFDKKIALLSYLLLLLLPPYWYYASRFLYSNIPFVSLLIIAGWAILNGALQKHKKKIYAVIFAASGALALVIRPVEIFWIAIAAAILSVIYRKNISGRRVLAVLAISAVMILPVLSCNLYLYGGILKTGYTLKEAVATGDDFFIGGLGDIRNNILPYGFHPRAIWNNFRSVFANLWWYGAPAVLGIFLWLRSRPKKKEKLYFFICLAVSAWLLVFYGSGVFTDNPSTVFTIGDSHFRYWLPMFIAWIPFAAYFFLRAASGFKYKKFIIGYTLVVCGFLSALVVLVSPDDGLFMVKNNLEQNYQVKKSVLKIAGQNDVIITSRQDKIFFPEQKVLYVKDINDFKSSELFLNISKINGRNFFYYGIGFNADEFSKLNEWLKIYGFRLERINIFGKEVLYKLKNINSVIVILSYCHIV